MKIQEIQDGYWILCSSNKETIMVFQFIQMESNIDRSLDRDTMLDIQYLLWDCVEDCGVTISRNTRKNEEEVLYRIFVPKFVFDIIKEKYGIKTYLERFINNILYIQNNFEESE